MTDTTGRNSESIRLSVIIPTYNRASFLPGCIRSLRAAGLEGLEIIVVDDGSTDDTRAVIERLQPGLIYIYQQNKMPGGARNTGIRAASGRYVAYLDSDDFWLPDVPARVLDLLDRHPELGAIFCDAKMGNPEEGYRSWFVESRGSEFTALPATELEPGLKVPDQEHFYRLMLKRNVIFTGAIVLRRDAVLEHGMFEEFCFAEDWETWLRMTWVVQFAFWHEPMSVYTKHAESATTSGAETMFKAWCDALLVHKRKMPNVSPVAGRIRDDALRYHLFQRAYLAYDRGDFALARVRFRDALNLSRFSVRSVRSAVLLSVCAMPGPLPGLLRKMGRRLINARLLNRISP